MWGISDGFARYVGRSHSILTRCAVFDGLVGTYLVDLPLADGSVKMDSTADIQRSCDVTIYDPTGNFTPAQFTDLLAPNGNEVKVWRGIRQVNEMIPLGVFGISTVDVKSDVEGGVQIGVTGYDRSRRVKLAAFTASYVVAAGTNVATAILNIVKSRLPASLGINYYFTPTAFVTPTTTPLVYQAGDDPWQACQDLAASIGCWLFFDGNGDLILKPIPDPTTLPIDWTYAEGLVSTILSADKKLDDQDTRNGVIVTGSSTSVTDQASSPVTATLWDTNPNSPTYYLGKFGKRPRFYQSNLITTAAQAKTAASGLLTETLGLAEDASFSSICNPAHELGDVVSIKVTKSKIDARYILDSFTVPLSHGANLDATTRKRDLT